MINGFGLGLGLKIFVQDISPRSLDGILLGILTSDESVLKPFLCPISSNPLDSSFAFTIGFFSVCLVHFIQIRWQIFGCVPTALSAALSSRLFSGHEV